MLVLLEKMVIDDGKGEVGWIHHHRAPVTDLGWHVTFGRLAVSVERVQTRAADTDGQFGGVLALVEVPDAVDGENFCSRCDTDGPESLSSQRHP